MEFTRGRAHRHAGGTDGVPARRHPAVRAAAARRPLTPARTRPCSPARRSCARRPRARASICAASRARDRHPRLARLAEWIDDGRAGEMTYLRRVARRATRSRAGAAHRSLGRLARPWSTTRVSVAVDRRPRAVSRYALGRRLSRRPARAAPPLVQWMADTAGRGLRGLLLRRQRSGAGARVRGAGRARLDRQEHLPDQSEARVVDLPRARSLTNADARARCAGARSVRHLHPLPRRVSDRRDRRAVRARCDALPLVPDDRSEGRRRRRLRPCDSRAGLRLRHLPGRLSVESPRGRRATTRRGSRGPRLRLQRCSISA